jgi:hypothetical protein
MDSAWIIINRKCKTWERMKFSSWSEGKLSCWKLLNLCIACFFCELCGASYVNVIFHTLRKTANPQSVAVYPYMWPTISFSPCLPLPKFSPSFERERESFHIYSSPLFMISVLLYRGLQFKACPSQNPLPFPRVCPTDFYIIASIPFVFSSYPVLLKLSVGDHLWSSKATTNKQF